jgi:hypothetical protein
VGARHAVGYRVQLAFNKGKGVHGCGVGVHDAAHVGTGRPMISVWIANSRCRLPCRDKDGACVIYENHVARVDLLKTPPSSLHPKQR